MNLLQRQQKDEKQAAKIEYIFQENKLSPYSVLSFIYWRYTKKIYRLSADIISDVASTYVDNIPVQVLKELPAWSIYVSAEELHTELPTPYPIHGFFFYPLFNNNGNIIRLFIVDDLKQGQGISGLKEKDVDVVDNIIRISIFWMAPTLTSAHWLIWRKESPASKRSLKISRILRIVILLFGISLSSCWKKEI